MTTRKTEAPDRWWNNPYCRTFFEYTAWLCAIEVTIIVYGITSSEKVAPAWEVAQVAIGLFLLFAAPVALVAGSGSLVRLAVRRWRVSAVEAADGQSRPQFYWPKEHYLQALLSAVITTAAMLPDIMLRPSRQSYLITFPWCIEGLTLLGICILRLFVFSLCLRPGRICAWAAATWRRGSWDRLGELLIAASLTFLIVIYLALHFFGGSRQGFVEFCAWVMTVSLVPLGLMLTGRGLCLVWRRLRGCGQRSPAVQ